MHEKKETKKEKKKNNCVLFSQVEIGQGLEFGQPRPNRMYPIHYDFVHAQLITVSVYALGLNRSKYYPCKCMNT